VRTIAAGDTIELSTVPYPFNIDASFASTTGLGSVRFQLSGPMTVDRYENTAPYTMFSDSAVLEMDPGSYTLTVTPYSDVSGSGTAGTAYTRSFTVDDDRSPTAFGATIATTTAGYCSIASGDTSCVADAVYTASTTGTPAGSLTYSWSVSSGFTIQSGQGTDTVTVRSTSGANVTGTITLTVSDTVDTIVATLSSTHIHTTFGTGTAGFTPVTPSSDSRLIYVSSSTGSDSNDGLSTSTPKQTLDAACNLMRSGYPDHVYLKCGDTWRNENFDNAKGGRSSAEPAVIHAYSTTGSFSGQSRPVVEGDGNNSEVWNQDNSGSAVQYLQFISIKFSAYKLDPTNAAFDPSGGGATWRAVNTHADILLEDCVFNYNEMVAQGYNGRMSNLAVRRCIFTGIYVNTSSTTTSSRPSNMFIHNIDGVTLYQNVLDYGGWNPTVSGAGANSRNHNLYLQNSCTDIDIEENIVCRASSHGLNNRSGGIMYNNFLGRNTVQAHILGYGDKGSPAGATSTFTHNVISETTPMAKGTPVATSITSALWGISEDEPDLTKTETVENNIVALLYDPNGIGGSKKGINLNGRTVGTGNIIYHHDTDTQGDSGGYSDPSRTLGSYNATLGGSSGTTGFDEFMTVVKARPMQTWDDNYSAAAINNYIRVGFDVSTI